MLDLQSLQKLIMNKQTVGTLYLIPNTLGDENREDQLRWILPNEVSTQAAKINHWVVENAKTARAFLKAVHSVTPLQKPLQEIQMNEWRGPRSSMNPKELITPLLQGIDVGLMSEAGLPAVADPGAEIVAAAHQAGAKVVPMVGPSSLMLALMASGMNGQRFLFHGYLPIKNLERTQTLKSLEAESRKFRQTQIWIETPYRNQGMLEHLMQTLNGETKLCVAIDLTLPNQQILSMSVSGWKNWMKNHMGELSNLDRRPAVFLLLA
jgi:16S rRNA (cytidine1402-2'-O)-methyltransferase